MASTGSTIVLSPEETAELEQRVEATVSDFWEGPENPYREFIQSKLRQDLNIPGNGGTEHLLIERVATLYSFCRLYERSLEVSDVDDEGRPIFANPNPSWNPVVDVETYMDVQKLCIVYMSQLTKSKENLLAAQNEREMMMRELGSALRHSLPDVLPDLKGDTKKLNALLVELGEVIDGRLPALGAKRGRR